MACEELGSRADIDSKRFSQLRILAHWLSLRNLARPPRLERGTLCLEGLLGTQKGPCLQGSYRISLRKSTPAVPCGLVRRRSPGTKLEQGTWPILVARRPIRSGDLRRVERGATFLYRTLKRKLSDVPETEVVERAVSSL